MTAVAGIFSIVLRAEKVNSVASKEGIAKGTEVEIEVVYSMIQEVHVQVQEVAKGR